MVSSERGYLEGKEVVVDVVEEEEVEVVIANGMVTVSGSDKGGRLAVLISGNASKLIIIRGNSRVCHLPYSPLNLILATLSEAHASYLPQHQC